MDKERFKKNFNDINKFTKEGKGINRLAYSFEKKEALEYLESICIEEGMDTRMDPCGNLIVTRQGKNPELPTVSCGSHIDTVYEGGKYDGTIGVLLGLEAMRSLNDKNIQTLHPIELIIFAGEESSRFGVSTIGSKAMVGSLDAESISNLKDRDGISIQESFEENELNFESIYKCERSKEELKAFLELHIEQGPKLDEKGLQIGVVTGIAAPTRLKVMIEGVAAHSGTTSMLNRKDALLGASEIILLVEKLAKEETHHDTVATVGVLDIKPSAMNVVPGYAEMKIDIRGIYEDSKEKVFKGLKKRIKRVAKDRKLNITWENISHEEPVLTDSSIQEKLISNCESLGLKYTSMPSGAGHDAMNMTKICPTGMIFIPSKNGISHNPEEYTSMDDILNGGKLLEKTLLDLAIEVN